MSVAPETRPQPHTDPDAIEGLAERLRETFRAGRTLPLDWRRGQIEQIGRMMKENADELVAALHADLGKPTLEAFTADLAAVKGEADLALKKLSRWTRPQKVSTPLSQRPARARIVREPLGVVLVIAPWNYPVQLLLSPLVGALAAGNCAVLKPSEITAHTSALLARLVPRYLDPDCVTLVEGGVPETTALLEQRWDHVFYTGNGTVGRVVMEAAARHLTPVTLELGGKSPCILDATANLDVAARRIAWGKWLNAGQTCVAPDYVLVQREREEELVERLARAVRGFYGDDPRQSPDYARIANVRHVRRLASLLKDGGDVAVGGSFDEEERYFAPTILRNVPTDAAVMQEEIFGPILPILPVRDADEAIAFVGERERPLALYVFTEDAGVEERAVTGTSSGGVCVNATMWHLANPDLPFGGVGPSGTGAYHGRATFETFSHRKSVVTKSTRLDPKMIYPPYGRWKTALIRRLL
jgi:aldehyde dehydrogenase (NAD+)